MPHWLGFGHLDRPEPDIRRVLSTFNERGLLYRTTNFIQDHCTIDELTFAYDLSYKLVRE